MCVTCDTASSSTSESSAALSVTVCAVLQFDDVNVSDDGSTVTSMLSDDVSTVTSDSGCESSTTS